MRKRQQGAEKTRKRVAYVKEMQESDRWRTRTVEDRPGVREVLYREHNGEESIRYEIRKSEMLHAILGEQGKSHDEMLGLYACRTYRAGEIITVYVSGEPGESVGAVNGEADNYRGYQYCEK